MKLGQKGSITVDYLFAFFLVSGLSLVIITFSATLSMVEVTQYVAFASARAFLSSNMSLAKQQEAARKKFNTLKNSPIVGPLYNGGWFDAPDSSFIADANIPAKYPAFKDYQQSTESQNLFHGVVIGFSAKILDFQIPFFGGTKKLNGNNGPESAFYTNINSFLGREPTFEECDQFNRVRWDKIKNTLGGNYSLANDINGYVVINDNGC